MIFAGTMNINQNMKGHYFNRFFGMKNALIFIFLMNSCVVTDLNKVEKCKVNLAAQLLLDSENEDSVILAMILYDNCLGNATSGQRNKGF